MRQHRQEVEVGVHPDLLHRRVGRIHDHGLFPPLLTGLELEHQLPAGLLRRQPQGHRAGGARGEHVHQERELRWLAAQVVDVGEEHQRLPLLLLQVGDHGADFEFDVVLVRDLQQPLGGKALHGFDVGSQVHRQSLRPGAEAVNLGRAETGPRAGENRPMRKPNPRKPG